MSVNSLTVEMGYQLVQDESCLSPVNQVSNTEPTKFRQEFIMVSLIISELSYCPGSHIL